MQQQNCRLQVVYQSRARECCYFSSSSFFFFGMQFRMIVFENYLFQRDNFRYFLSFCAELCSVSLFSYFSSNLLNNIIKQSIPIYGDVCGTHRAKQLISRIWRARGSSNENWMDLIGWQLFKMLFGSSCVCECECDWH